MTLTYRPCRGLWGIVPNYRKHDMETTSPFDSLFGIGATAEETAAAQADHAVYMAAQAAAESARVTAHNAPSPRTIRPHCGRCGGSGYLPSFQHIKGGACFACN